MFSVTLKELRENHACFEGYNKVVRMLQGKSFTDKDEERESYIRFSNKELISLVDICENNGIDDAIWSLCCIKNNDRDIRLFAIWCARQVEYLNPDPRVSVCNDVSERFANGMATVEELSAARTAAAARTDAAAYAAADAAAAYAAYAADAADAAAYAYAYAAADAAAYAAAAYAYAAADADAADAAAYAARTADAAAQKEMFIKMCNGTAPWQEVK